MTMKWYNAILADPDQDRPQFVGTCHDFYLQQPDALASALKCGERFVNWDPSSYLRSESPDNDGPALDVLGEDLQIPVFSHDLRRILESKVLRPGEVQFLPVHVFTSSGDEIPGYSIANVLDLVPALSYERSEMLGYAPNGMMDPRTGKPLIWGLGRPALIGNKLVGRSFVRLREYPGMLFANDGFRRVFLDHAFSGIEFVEVDVV